MPRSLEDIIAHADALADRFENYEPQPGDEGNAPPLLNLYIAVHRRANADRDLLEAVAAARDEGVTWAVIGGYLGTSGEAARQRYGALVGRRPTTQAGQPSG